jgi:Skp family chaperone for outer membrane proteins
VDWDRAETGGPSVADLDSAPAEGASFGPLPPEASRPKNYDAWRKSLADSIYRTRKLDLFKSTALNEVSRPGESERDFRIRLRQAARERRDEAVEKLRQKYAPKFTALAERARRAHQAVERETEQARQSKVQTAISFGTTVLGAIFGRKTISAGTIGRATTAARGVGRSYKESQDIARAEETVGALKQQMDDLEAQMKAEVADTEARLDPATEQFETVSVRPKKTDVDVRTIVLAWAPHWQRPGSAPEPAWA